MTSSSFIARAAAFLLVYTFDMELTSIDDSKIHTLFANAFTSSTEGSIRTAPLYLPSQNAKLNDIPKQFSSSSSCTVIQASSMFESETCVSSNKRKNSDVPEHHYIDIDMQTSRLQATTTISTITKIKPESDHKKIARGTGGGGRKVISTPVLAENTVSIASTTETETKTTPERQKSKRNSIKGLRLIKITSAPSPSTSSTSKITTTTATHEKPEIPEIPINVIQKQVVPKKKGLLTREEEAKLTYAIRSLRKAVKIRDELSMKHKTKFEEEYGAKIYQYDPMAPKPEEVKEEEWAHACGLSVLNLRRIMRRGKDARTQLVAKNAGLVVQIAKRYHYRGNYDSNSILTLQDMIQEGNLGLMEAAERFDPKRGFKFGTYATWWVRQRILRAIADHSRTIRLPVHVHTMLNTIDKKRKEMTSLIGRVPSQPELAHELGIPLSKLQLYTDSSRSVLSLEAPIYNNKMGKSQTLDSRSISDRIASDNPSPEDTAEVDFLRQDIRAVVNGLNYLERDVLVQRFGLDDGNYKTVSEVASKLGISLERARLLEARAINKLRHPGRNYKLKEYIGDNSGRVAYNHGKNISKQNRFYQNMDIPKSETPEQIWSV